MRARASAFLIILATALWAGRAAALDCKSTEPYVVVPGTYDRIAPRNTRVFVDHHTRVKIQRVELIEQETGRAIPVRVEREVRRQGSRARQYFELAPLALLDAEKRYAVIAQLEDKRSELASFVVAAEIDQEPPRMGNVRMAFGDGGGPSGGRSVTFSLQAMFDDRTSDRSLRLLVWDLRTGSTAPAGSEGLYFAFAGASGGTNFSLARDAECYHDNFDFPQDLAGRRYLVALADAAGNLSQPQALPFARAAEQGRAARAKSGLYYVAGVGLISGKTLLVGLISALATPLVLVVLLRLRRRRQRA